MERLSTSYDVPLLESVNELNDLQGPTMTGYKTETWRGVLYIFFCVITGGLLFLLGKWLLNVRLALLHSKCSFREATYVFVSEPALKDNVSDEQTEWLNKVERNSHNSDKWFIHKGLRFVFDEQKSVFICHNYNIEGRSFAKVHSLAEVADANLAERASCFGPNIMDVPVPSVVQLLVDELLHPFYVFQIASVTIWILQKYYIYASTIFVLASVALGMSVVQTRRNNLNLAQMARHHSLVSILRENKVVECDSEQLLPGDVIVLPQGNVTIACDVILLEGECVVNESSLTGESVPVIKSALPKTQAKGEANFDFGTHVKHVLFCGTDLRRVKGNVSGLVVRTGYKTAKGELIRQILYPKALNKFTFYRDGLIFILVLFCISLAGFGWAIYQFVTAGATAGFIILRTLDLFTTVIPPALPIAMTAGAAFAVYRLREQRIFCVVPKMVNIVGRVNVMCFDKTGTLTRDHMDVYCVRAATDGKFEKEVSKISQLNEMTPLVWSLAACHSVVKLSGAKNTSGETVGDPLEVKMMQFSNWHCSLFEEKSVTMTSPSVPHRVIYTLHRNEFASQLARMSVVVRAPDDQLWSLVKGSPEEIKRRCDPRSVPGDFDRVLASYTAQGMRTIALACSQLSSSLSLNLASLQRDEVETNLHFAGLLVMVNPLKPETEGLLQRLQEARMRVVMITGDNALTAINVARKAGMSQREESCVLVEGAERKVSVVLQESVEERGSQTWEEIAREMSNSELAMTGPAFEDLMNSPNEGLREELLQHVSVFARCNPLQKAQIVHSLKSDFATVGMCGDGSNDCGALKVADAGISICDQGAGAADAAVAAPFSGSDLSSVEQLLLEGRCALATSFSLFKFMIMYSTIQFTGVIVCYVFVNLFADLQFLWVDLFLILPLSFTIGLTRPADKLVPNRPPATLFKFSVLLSIIGHVLFMAALNVAVASWAMAQPFIDSINQPSTLQNGTTPSRTVIVTIMWFVGNFCYVGSAFNFSIARPFRQPFFYNIWLSLSLFVATLCNILWYWVQTPSLLLWWTLLPLPYGFLGAVFGLLAGYLVFTYLFEVLVVLFIQEIESRKENHVY